MHGPKSTAAGPAASRDVPSQAFYDHSAGQRTATDPVMFQIISSLYPEQSITIVPESDANILAYAQAGYASYDILEVEDELKTPPLKWRAYIPASHRIDGEEGILADRFFFVKFACGWKGKALLIYLVEGRDGNMGYNMTRNYYIIGEQSVVDDMIFTIGQHDSQLHEEIWVFMGGSWQKDPELWKSVQKAEWANVILDTNMKKSLIDDTNTFFDSRDTYKSLGIPWKRGLIFYGPPGNGKTISIKATMHMLEKRKLTVPTLYVRSLASWMGPEMALREVFTLARREAPCYLVFEDLDSMITPDVRSFFFNEVDGLAANDGIMIVGSTNHLDQLDPGIAKRPSRFDRKFLFPDPNKEQRIKYAEFWKNKLKSNKDLEFPEELCPAIAGITDGFSFAYMQEAFMASLLAIATSGDDDDDEDIDSTTYKNQTHENVHSTEARTDEHNIHQMASLAISQPGGNIIFISKTLDDKLDKYPLWREMKHQVKILREEMDNS